MPLKIVHFLHNPHSDASATWSAVGIMKLKLQGPFRLRGNAGHMKWANTEDNKLLIN